MAKKIRKEQIDGLDSFYQTLSVGTGMGQLDLTFGGTVYVNSIAISNKQDANTHPKNSGGLQAFSYNAPSALNYPVVAGSGGGGGISFYRNNTAGGLLSSFDIVKAEHSEEKLRFRVGISTTAKGDWKIIASEEYVDNAIADLGVMPTPYHRRHTVITPYFTSVGVARIKIARQFAGMLKIHLTGGYASANVNGYVELSGGFGTNANGALWYNQLRCTTSIGLTRNGFYIDPVLKKDTDDMVYFEVHKKSAPQNNFTVEIELLSVTPFHASLNPVFDSFDSNATVSTLTNEVALFGLAGTGGDKIVTVGDDGTLKRTNNSISDFNKYFPREQNIVNVVIDCNSQILEGVYYRNMWANQPVPYPSNVIGVLNVKRYSNDWISQEWTPIDNYNRSFVRKRYSGTTWSPWVEIANSNNLANFLPTAGGTMTGAIDFTGSNLIKQNGVDKLNASSMTTYVAANAPANGTTVGVFVRPTGMQDDTYQTLFAGDGSLRFKFGARLHNNGQIVLQQSGSSNATGQFWQNLADTEFIAGIGAHTNGDTVLRLYMGWGITPWTPANNFSVSATELKYKNQDIYHTGNFNPVNVDQLNITYTTSVYTFSILLSNGVQKQATLQVNNTHFIIDNGILKLQQAIATQIANGNTAHGWGNHSAQGYLKAADLAPYALANQIPTVHNGQLTVNTSGDIVGNFVFTANQNGNTTVTLGLSTNILNAIADGVTAYSWGDHGTQGYLKLAALNGYATQAWVNAQIANVATPGNGSVILQGVGSLIGTATFSMNQSNNVVGSFDLTPQTKADIQTGVDANSKFENLFGSIGQYAEYTNVSAGGFYPTTKAFFNVFNPLNVPTNVDVEDHFIKGARLVLQGVKGAGVVHYHGNFIDEMEQYQPSVSLEYGNREYVWDDYGGWRQVL